MRKKTIYFQDTETKAINIEAQKRYGHKRAFSQFVRDACKEYMKKFSADKK